MAADPTRRLHLASGLILLGTFVAGAFAGGGVHAWLAPNPAAHGGGFGLGMGPPGGLPPYLFALDLTPDQEAKAREIFARHREAVEGLLRESFPKVRERSAAMHEELAGILTPEQRKKLETMRMGPGRGRGPGGHGPMHGCGWPSCMDGGD